MKTKTDLIFSKCFTAKRKILAELNSNNGYNQQKVETETKSWQNR